MKRIWIWIFLAAELLLAMLSIRGGLQAAQIAPLNGQRLLVCWCGLTALAVGGGLWWQFRRRRRTLLLEAVSLGGLSLALDILSVVLRRWCLPIPATGEDAFYAALSKTMASWSLTEPLWMLALFLPWLAAGAMWLRANFWRLDDEDANKAQPG